MRHLSHLTRGEPHRLDLAVAQLAIRLSHKFPARLNILSARPSPAVQAININNHSIKQHKRQGERKGKSEG